MSRTIGTALLCIAVIIVVVFVIALVAALTGVPLAAWIVAAFLRMGQPLLIVLLLCLLVGLELRFLSCDTSIPGVRRFLTVLAAPVLVVLGLAAAVLSRVGLTSFPAYTMANLLILAVGGMWLGFYLFRRSRV